ncbi:MAG: hypothetical protein E7300_00255 [Lachnospiraceae bacterium]|nr:hypothetical protein [Lachnospiraceae bacterium]
MKKRLGIVLALALAMLPCATAYAKPVAAGGDEHLYTLIQPIGNNALATLPIQVNNDRYPGYVTLYMSGISRGWETGYDSSVVIVSDNGEILGGPGVECIDGKPIRYIRYHDGSGLMANIKEGFAATIYFTDWDGSGDLNPAGILLPDGRMILLATNDQLAFLEGNYTEYTEYADTVQYGGTEHTGTFNFCVDQKNK